MQYRPGTVSVENGSQTVTGDIQFFLANVEAGDIFIRVGDAVSYEVAAVVSDTELTLASNYAGETAGGQEYVVHRDFTPVKGYPYVQKGDVETALILKRFAMMLDAE